jgi:hypothetical protein
MRNAALIFVAICGGCRCHTPPGASGTPSSGNTGAFGVVVVANQQKLYLPMTAHNSAGNGFIAVVDVAVKGRGISGAPALIHNIDLGTPAYATTTGGDATVLVAASTAFPDVWLIDPVTDTVTNRFQLDSTYGLSSFSAGGGYVTGIAMDSKNKRAILSVWNGFALLDVQRGVITSVILAPPSENFGFDENAQRIVAPFYDCASANNHGTPLTFCSNYKAPSGAPMTDGVNVIDLVDGTVYTYQSPTAANPAAPAGGEPDAAAVDPTTGVTVVPAETDGYQNVIDLAHAVFDKSAKSVTATDHTVPASGFTGVAIEPRSHYAFFEQELSSSAPVGVMDLQAANTGSGLFLNGRLPNTPEGIPWSNLGDPHGIAVTISIIDWAPVGFVANSARKWVARVDLDTMIGLPQINGGITTSDLATAVTYLDATKSP